MCHPSGAVGGQRCWVWAHCLWNPTGSLLRSVGQLEPLDRGERGSEWSGCALLSACDGTSAVPLQPGQEGGCTNGDPARTLGLSFPFPLPTKPKCPFTCSLLALLSADWPRPQHSSHLGLGIQVPGLAYLEAGSEGADSWACGAMTGWGGSQC